MCPKCRDQLQAKQPKEDGLTELRKDMMEANRRLRSQMEAFQERLLKKVEDMMNRGPEARDIQTTQPHRSPGIRTTKRKPPPRETISDTKQRIEEEQIQDQPARAQKTEEMPKILRKGKLLNSHMIRKEKITRMDQQADAPLRKEPIRGTKHGATRLKAAEGSTWL
jgi:hypothetical protein